MEQLLLIAFGWVLAEGSMFINREKTSAAAWHRLESELRSAAQAAGYVADRRLARFVFEPLLDIPSLNTHDVALSRVVDQRLLTIIRVGLNWYRMSAEPNIRTLYDAQSSVMRWDRLEESVEVQVEVMEGAMEQAGGAQRLFRDQVRALRMDRKLHSWKRFNPWRDRTPRDEFERLLQDRFKYQAPTDD